MVIEVTPTLTGRAMRSPCFGRIRSALRSRFVCLILSAALVARAYGAGPCYQWSLGNVPWFSAPDAALSAFVAYCQANATTSYICLDGCPRAENGITVTYISDGLTPTVWPYYWGAVHCHVAYLGNQWDVYHTHITLYIQTNPAGCQCYLTATAPDAAQCGPTCNGVGHPINPASGAVYDTIVDIHATADSISFKRFYNSADVGSPDLNAGWRHSFSRSITPKYANTGYQPYMPVPGNSSLYSDEPTACTNGFAEIKAQVSTWANANATYSNGVCTVSVGSISVGNIRILYTSQPNPTPTTTPIGFDVTRDDGQLVRFWLNGSSMVAPPSIGLKLQQTSSGYTLQDENDSVETYDVNGRLLSITGRAGVAQTMSYDSSGHLSAVTDSFGHSLSYTYDSQGHLSSVTKH
jgi:YD repeat-containing protein